MDIVSINVKLFNELLENLKSLVCESETIKESDDYSLQVWLDNQDVCQILNISKRTLQTFRNNEKLPYSQIDHKIYYKPEDVEALLASLRRNK